MPRRGSHSHAPRPIPAPKGLYRTPHRQTHGNLETRSWTPFPNFLGGQSILTVAQAVKSVDFQRPAPPTKNSVSRNLRGPISSPHEPPQKVQNGTYHPPIIYPMIPIQNHQSPSMIPVPCNHITDFSTKYTLRTPFSSPKSPLEPKSPRFSSAHARASTVSGGCVSSR